MSDVHLWVRLGRERYALPVEHVREVSELGGLSAVPGAGPAVLGVRNLQGRVLPVFDLARVLSAGGDRAASRVVIAEDGDRVAGLAVDEVTDVRTVDAAIEPTDIDFLGGVVLDDGQLVGIVDVGSLFTALAQEAA